MNFTYLGLDLLLIGKQDCQHLQNLKWRGRVHFRVLRRQYISAILDAAVVKCLFNKYVNREEKGIKE